MAKVDKPEIGAEMYAVFEHLYSNNSAPARSLKEYCVCKGTVRGFYTGSYTDVCMLFRGPEGCPLLASIAALSFALHSACVLPSTFLLMRFPVSGW